MRSAEPEQNTGVRRRGARSVENPGRCPEVPRDRARAPPGYARFRPPPAVARAHALMGAGANDQHGFYLRW